MEDLGGTRLSEPSPDATGSATGVALVPAAVITPTQALPAEPGAASYVPFFTSKAPTFQERMEARKQKQILGKERLKRAVALQREVKREKKLLRIKTTQKKKRGPKQHALYFNKDEFFQKVEAYANDSDALNRGLESEKIMLRAQALELLKRCRDGTATARYDYRGEAVPLSDSARVSTICRLTKILSELELADWRMGQTEVISIDNFKVWAASLANAIKQEFPSVEDQKKFLKIAQLIGEPAKGA